MPEQQGAGEHTVFYINRYTDPNPGIVVRIRNRLTGHRYRYRREDEPFSTSVPISEIDNFEDERIREALWRQHEGNMEKSSDVIIPIVFAHRSLANVIGVPKRPLNVRFTARGVEELND